MTAEPSRRPDEAEVAAQRLSDALTDMHPRLTPCQDPGNAAFWFDDDAAIRRVAVEACRASCPVLAPCGTYAAAAGESWGVWGGRDREARRRAEAQQEAS